MRMDELQVGDILLKKCSGSVIHILTVSGQALFSHNLSGGKSTTIHAALYAGEGMLLESSGPGLQYANVDPQNDTYEVYRLVGAPPDTQLPEIAADIGYTYYMMQQHHRKQEKTAYPGVDELPKTFGNYSRTKATGSLFGSSNFGNKAINAAEKLWEGDSEETFYCSNFVIRCYAAAGVTAEHPDIIPADLRQTSPKELQARLNKDDHWKHMGRLEP